MDDIRCSIAARQIWYPASGRTSHAVEKRDWQRTAMCCGCAPALLVARSNRVPRQYKELLAKTGGGSAANVPVVVVKG